MSINTEYLEKCLCTLEKAYSLIKTTKEGSIDYEMYRNALVKGFEMILEQSGKYINEYDNLPKSFQKEIEKDYIVIFNQN